MSVTEASSEAASTSCGDLESAKGVLKSVPSAAARPRLARRRTDSFGSAPCGDGAFDLRIVVSKVVRSSCTFVFSVLLQDPLGKVDTSTCTTERYDERE